MSLDIALETPVGTPPASVEWTLNYPTTDFSSATVTAGPTAVGSSKLVSCDSTAGSSRCVLWGDNSIAMANGVVANISLVISGSTLDTSSQVQLSTPIAAAPSGFPFNSSATGGVVTIIQPAGMNGFACNPVSLTPPAVSTCNVALTGAAPAGGASIALSASLPDVSFPAFVVIPQGISSAMFTVTPMVVTTPAAVNMTASYLGVAEGFGLTVNPPPTALVSFGISPGVISSGQTATGTVGLSGPAGSGGVAVGISSSNPLVIVPATVTVPQGSTTATFLATAGIASAPTAVVLTASYTTAAIPATLTVNPTPIVLTSVKVTPAVISSGQTAAGTVTISAPAGVGGITATLNSSNSAATVPASVTVPQGATTASFTATAGAVTVITPLVITGVYASVNQVANLTVDPIVLSGVSITPPLILNGQTATGTVTISAAAGTGGMIVNLISSNTSAASVPGSVTIPQGSTTCNFTATAGTVNRPTSLAITAYRSGVRKNTYLTIHRH